jgi:hypothetical protein
LHDRLKEGKFRRHTNAIKFTLTEQNMKERVRFCVNMLDSQSIPDDPTFKSLYNVIYIDGADTEHSSTAELVLCPPTHAPSNGELPPWPCRSLCSAAAVTSVIFVAEQKCCK